MKLAILTPSIPARIGSIIALSAEITRQITAGGFQETVEHLILSDNCARSIGAKRQSLVDIARGQYIAFVDDDDWISSDYISRIITATATQADVITFQQRAIYNGQESIVHFGLNHHDGPFTPGGITLRAPWHVCAWNREKVAGCLFGESNYGEDLVWCQQARRRIATGYHIPEILHTYRHDAATTAAPEPAAL